MVNKDRSGAQNIWWILILMIIAIDQMVHVAVRRAVATTVLVNNPAQPYGSIGYSADENPSHDKAIEVAEVWFK